MQKSTFVLEVLRHEFSKRVQKNPNYSQRGFAKQLGVSHTLLSLILNGYRKPSRKLVEKVAEKLQFSPNKTAAMLESLGKTTGKSKGAQSEKVRQAILLYQKMPLDQFALVSEWQHFAILSLLELPDTEFTAPFIAKRLGLSVQLAKISMQRLLELKIIAQDETSGKWRQKPGPIVIENSISTSYTRKFQRQLIDKAAESLEQDPIEIRDHSSTTFVMNPKHIPYALKKIRAFRRELSDELEALGDPGEVYNLTVQIFPTSRRSKS